MIKEITMPAGGQTTDTSTIGTWLVKEGDQVKRGDAILEIETDKATLTVESYAAGTVLAILVEEGEVRSAGDVIAYVGKESDRAEAEARRSGGKGADGQAVGADSAAGRPAEEKEDSAEAVSIKEEDEYQPIDRSEPVRYVGNGGSILTDIKAMPNAKLMAKENGILLKDVAGFAGKNILKRQDVQNYIANGQKTVSQPAGAADTKVPLTGMRKVIARRMLESTQNIPSFNVTVEVDMAQCIAFRKLINGVKDGKKISYNDILFKCVEAAIRKYPYVNASYSDEAIILHHDVNIGLAVSVEGGLVVPVNREINRKNIGEISEVNKQNVVKAREGKLQPEDMSGGTVTVSNLGMYPVTQFTAVINPPEVCILAIGMIEEKPVWEDGAQKAASVMKITGTFDHRVVDGAYGAQFLTELKSIIENPALALM